MPPPLTVLVVDDHRDTALLTARILRSAGHVAHTAGTCAEAVEIARGLPVDVLLADIGLPDGDGCELLAAVRALRPVRGVAFTAYVAPADYERFFRAGFASVVEKPARIETLLAALAPAAAPAAGLLTREQEARRAAADTARNPTGAIAAPTSSAARHRGPASEGSDARAVAAHPSDPVSGKPKPQQ
ncbi:MAG: hybrid sensor histidine kinase/response regulator [Phycisphaerales bacterium]|nr:hybrid sensor histidine kinase/response regulator [Phycisphaerales bacterium]